MSFYDEHAKPRLTEPGVKYFLNETLKQCHQFKEKHHNMLFNVGMLVGFFVILGILLLYKYKGKLTPAERQEKGGRKEALYIIKNTKLSTGEIKSTTRAYNRVAALGK